MSRKKLPYIPLYTGDYIKDTRSLSLPAKGAWSDILLFMHAQETDGILEGTIEDFARLIGGTIEETEKVLLELCLKKVCDREPGENGFFKIICRRMVREAAISAIRSEVGSKGGSKTQAKVQAKTKQKREYEYDNEDDNELENKNESVSKVKIFESLFSDELFVEQLTMTHKGKDIKHAFEECYTHHSNAPNPPQELWEWKQKLNTWLSIKKSERTNGKQQTTNKHQQHTGNLAASFTETYGSVLGAGPDG